MTDEKKTGETSETPYPGTLSWAATRLLEAICDAAKAVAEMLWESISRVFRDARRLMRKLAKALDPKWRCRRRRALARSRRIAHWRIDNHVPLKQLARAAGVNLSSLSHAIRGGREVKMNLLFNLANAMGEDPRDIVRPKALASQETK